MTIAMTVVVPNPPIELPVALDDAAVPTQLTTGKRLQAEVGEVVYATASNVSHVVSGLSTATPTQELVPLQMASH